MDQSDPTTRLLSSLLSASAVRMQVIWGNLANQNTPGFQRQVVHFEDQFLAALKKGDTALERIQPRIEADTITPSRPDGNNVNLELEMNAMRENELLQQAYTQILRSRFGLLDTAVTGGPGR